MFIIALTATYNQPAESLKTTSPPCCSDTLSQVTCQRLQRVNSVAFGHRCNSDVEFRLIQCCLTCNRHKGSVEYDRIAESLVADHCFDRYGEQFCKRFVDAKDIWERSQRSCDGNTYLAFRVCKKVLWLL
ncbi:hypothetical protein M3Y97_00243000 [Aphelenchoides bicaudatus]|nr:hypothetical protein M3Y97_00243000 [Aphelenchoides bicaudatus]